jgi:hypothetical protein
MSMLPRMKPRMPIEPAAMVDRQVIEWDKDDIDALKFMKVDCLALGMRPALDLERAQRVGLADHGVGARVLRRDGREIELDALRVDQEIECPLHARQHFIQDDA